MSKHNFIKTWVRKMSLQWPERTNALNNAFVERKENSKTGRMAKHYKCAHCQGVFVAKEVNIDHIEPIIPLDGFDNWDSVIERTLCPASGFQVLCIECHKAKSKHENEIRKLNQI